MYFIDLDGTLYLKQSKHSEVLGIAGIEAVSKYANRGQVCFITNSGCSTSLDVQAKLEKLGISISDTFVCYTAREHLMSMLSQLQSQHECNQIFCVSSSLSVQEEAGRRGWDCDLSISKALNVNNPSGIIVAFFVDEIEALAQISEIVAATAHLINGGARALISSHDPSVAHIVSGQRIFMPGPGCLLSMLKTVVESTEASDRISALGKGTCSAFLECAKTKAEAMLGRNIKRNSIIVIGDRTDTDVRAGLAWGVKTCVVGTGCFHEGNMVGYDRPHYFADNIGDALCAFETSQIKTADSAIDFASRCTLGIHRFIANILYNVMQTTMPSAPLRRVKSCPAAMWQQ